MEMLYGALLGLGFSSVIWLIYRYEQARRFDLKVKRLCNKIISEILIESKVKEGKELEVILDRYNYFMRCLYKYSLFSYWFSRKKLKLHYWFDRKFIDEVNKKKAKVTYDLDDETGVYFMYNKIGNL